MVYKMAEATGNETVSDIYRAQQTKLFIGDVPKGDDKEGDTVPTSHRLCPRQGTSDLPKEKTIAAPLSTPPVESETVVVPPKKDI